MRMPKKFKSEKDEAEFWDKHGITDFLEDTQEAKALELSPEAKTGIIKRRQNKVLLTLRLDPGLIEEAKKLADRKAIGYQTLMRMWIAEGVIHEKSRAR